MSVDPLVSIGLPVFNGAKYIGECIDSVLAQTFSRFELVISDNASTDATEEICRSYARQDSRIKYVRQAENRGPTANFEYVLQHSKCQYFMWLASDDKIAGTFVEKLYGVMKANPALSLAMSDAVIIDGRGAVLAEVALDPIRVEGVGERWTALQRVFFRNPTSKTYFCICGLGRRDVLLQSELNYRGLVRYRDGVELPFLAQIALAGRIGSIPEPLWFHRHHDGSFSIRSEARITTWQRLDNMLNISTVLFRIACNAKLGAFRKVGLFWTILWTLGKGLAGMIPGVGPLYRKLSSALSG